MVSEEIAFVYYIDIVYQLSIQKTFMNKRHHCIVSATSRFMVRLIWSFEYTSSYIEVSVLLRKKVRGSPLGPKGLEAAPNLMFFIVNHIIASTLSTYILLVLHF